MEGADHDTVGNGTFDKHAVESQQPPLEQGELYCPMLSAADAALLTVPYLEIEARLQRTLEEYGVAIVAGVLTPAECVNMEQLFSADLQELFDENAIKRAGGAVQKTAGRAMTDVGSLPRASAECLGPMERLRDHGLPHGRLAWAGRLHPGVRRVYEVIHGTGALVSSCDNGFFAPGAYQEQTSNRNWPHVDHNVHDMRFSDESGVPLGQWDVFQGLLYVWGSAQTHASTTVLWCGSHREVYDEIVEDEVMKKRGRAGNHFVPLGLLMPGEASARLSAGWRRSARRMPVPAGALLVWSSRTVHQGWSGGPRLAQPVCWEPAERRSEKARERKLRLAALGLPSTHWASLGLPHTLLGDSPAPPLATEAIKNKSGVQLPLRPAVRPLPLVDGVYFEDLWRSLGRADWKKPLPQNLKDELERSIKDEFKAVL